MIELKGLRFLLSPVSGHLELISRLSKMTLTIYNTLTAFLSTHMNMFPRLVVFFLLAYSYVFPSLSQDTTQARCEIYTPLVENGNIVAFPCDDVVIWDVYIPPNVTIESVQRIGLEQIPLIENLARLSLRCAQTLSAMECASLFPQCVTDENGGKELT